MFVLPTIAAVAAAVLHSASVRGASPAAPAPHIFPGETWTEASPADAGLDAAALGRARDYALTGGGSGLVVHRGKRVIAWGDQSRRYDLKSTSKSIGATALALAVKDGKLQLEDRAAGRHPSFGVPPESNRETGWLGEVTVLHLATQTAGFAKPGGYQKLLFRPGTRWHYSDGGPNWLAEIVTLAYGRDVEGLLFERVFSKIGVGREDLRWRNNAYRPRTIAEANLKRCEFGSGVHANVDAMARIGLLYLRGGKWGPEQILPADYVASLRAPPDWMAVLPVHKGEGWAHGKTAAAHYSLLWWNNADGDLPGVPRDAYWSWGLYDSLILVVPSLDLVAARAGQSWKRTDGQRHYAVLEPFFGPLVQAAKGGGGAAVEPGAAAPPPPAAPIAPAGGAPYPPSPVIADLRWAPAGTIVRRAAGSDNWPLTWADDGHLYTAYGDGWGFRPKVPHKLSLGLARVSGGPAEFRGENLRAPTLEQKGDGASGLKASGILMVDGVLYLWARNAGNARLASSSDRGQTWSWAGWALTESFGYPSFINFGQNYAGARDGFVYTVSHDADSAYRGADRMVLARVPRDRVLERAAYTFFERLDGGGQPVWTRDIARRGAVFEHPGGCYRSSVSYHPGTRRYLWCQVLPGGSPRFEGGFGIYDAPEPWGPWTSVFFTRRWDVGPGETNAFPTQWMEPDGRTLHLVFSGEDAFSVRRAELVLREGARR